MKTKKQGKSATNSRKFLFARAMMDLMSDSEVETPEAGYRTTKGWSDHLGIPVATMFKRLQELTKLGRCETKTFRVKAAVTIRKIPHYRIDPDWLKKHGL